MPSNYLDRYLSGEYEKVWAELVGLGERVGEEPFHSEAEAVAQETMRRARHNVELLVERLRGLQYRFVFPNEAWLPPDEELLAGLAEVEQLYGPVPLALRAWYEIVGSVNFMGAHPKLSSYYGLDWGGSNRLTCSSDPMVIERAEEGAVFSLRFMDGYDGGEDGEGDEDEDGDDEGPPYAIMLAPDAIHKTNHSGGSPTALRLPAPIADTPLISDDWDGVTFVSYLRVCFQWGGFPGFKDCPQEHPGEELALVTEGLLEI